MAGGAAGGSAGGETSVETFVNRSACTGTGHASGAIAGQQLSTTTAQAQVTNSDAVSIILSPSPLTAGSRVLLIEFDAVANQLAYSVSETNCGIAERTGSGWRGVERLAACEVQFAQLTWASTAGVCSGTMVGQMTGIGSGNAPVTATFAAPVNFVMPNANRCRRSGGSCSTDADCCTRSCSRYIGVCN